jgi:elongation factor P
MILAGDVRPGVKILHNNEPYNVIDVTFVKQGKGGAFSKTKMKNLITNLVREVTFRNEEKLDQPDLSHKTFQFLYSQGKSYSFMDQESFEDVTLDESMIEKVKYYLREQEIYTMLFWGDRLIDIQAPLHMIMVVTETPPGVRGDTAQGAANKPATLDTGLVVLVPLFVDNGDKLKIDTRTGEYVERIKK